MTGVNALDADVLAPCITKAPVTMTLVMKDEWVLAFPESKVHGANMGPIWGQQDPAGPHVGHINFAIWVPPIECNHMSIMASQITDNSTVCSTICSGAHQRKLQSSMSLVFLRGIHRWPVDSPHKGNMENGSISLHQHAQRRIPTTTTTCAISSELQIDRNANILLFFPK